MKNKLTDLNDHLFAQIERLSDDEIEPEQLDQEIKRGGAMVAVADKIIRNAAVQLAAAKLVADYGKGTGRDPMAYLPQIEGRARIEGNASGKTKQ